MAKARTRAFTLMEIMVASAMAFILVAAGAQLAASMARNVKRSEEQADLGMRAAVGHAFLSNLLSSVAYSWTVTHQVTPSTTTGSLGEGGCAQSTGMCAANGQVLAPLQICNSATVGTTIGSCSNPTPASTADALWTYVPRDDLIEAVAIVDLNGTAMSTDCTSANIANPAVFRVRGVNAVAWAADDLVLVSKRGHATLGTVRAAFPVGNNPATDRALSLDVGTGTTLAFDAGTSNTACNAQTSLVGAKVFRIRHVVLKHDNSTRRLLYGHRDQGSAALTFDSLLSDVDDFQLQFDVAHLESNGGVAETPGVCTSNLSNIFGGSNLTTAPCNAQRLNGDISDTHVNSVVGLRAGLLLRTSVETQTANKSQPGLFDRTSTFNDRRLRRSSILYVGLPNAFNL